jgi:branched-chain amino acid transport system ATP-binding protein
VRPDTSNSALSAGDRAVSPVLELVDVEAAYGDVRVLHGVSLQVEEGAIVALLGANGAGKTTTLRAISNTVRKTGEVVLGGRRITSRSPEAIARLGVAHVPEGRGVFAELTVRENLRLGSYTRRDRSVARDVDGVLGYFPRLRERERQPAGTLSGGEQQMLALGRALLARPRLLMLDEPSLGLAPLVVREVFEILGTLNRELGLAVLVVEQNAALALEAASRACLLEVGRIVLEGDAAVLREDESVRRSYLGY